MNRVYKEMNSYGLLDSLYHFGILGMRWGVRRYQNKDGSLTNAGRKRYGYGSVTVDPQIRDKPGYVRISKKGYNGHIDIKENVFREYERQGHKEAVKLLSDYMGMDYNSVVRMADHDRGNAKRASKIIDEYMDQRLTTVIDNIDTKFELGMHPKNNPSDTDELPNVKKNNNPSGNVKLPKVEKNKYANKSFSAEQAIDKAYEDLEKLIPNYHNLSQEDQDRLWMEYSNRTGLYKYTY